MDALSEAGQATLAVLRRVPMRRELQWDEVKRFFQDQATRLARDWLID